jgi:hypothetical protein
VGSRVVRRRDGFTLIDVLVSTSLLLTAALGMTAVTAFIAQMRGVDRERVAALRALDREAAAVELCPFDELLAVQDGRGFPVLKDDAGRVKLRALNGDADGLPGSVTVSVAPDVGDASRLLEVTLRVDWIGSSGPQAVSRTLRISRLGAGA